MPAGPWAPSGPLGAGRTLDPLGAGFPLGTLGPGGPRRTGRALGTGIALDALGSSRTLGAGRPRRTLRSGGALGAADVAGCIPTHGRCLLPRRSALPYCQQRRQTAQASCNHHRRVVLAPAPTSASITVELTTEAKPCSCTVLAAVRTTRHWRLIATDEGLLEAVVASPLA